MEVLKVMRNFILVVVIFVVGFSVVVLGDEVYLKNGDRITGKVKELSGGKLVFESALAGTLTMDAGDIETISSDESVEVYTNDGRSFAGRLLKGEGGRFGIEGGGELGFLETASFNLLPEAKKKWSGGITVGFSSTHGNTKTEDREVDIRVERKTAADNFLFRAEYLRGEQEDPDTGEQDVTEDTWLVRGKYDRFLTEKVYGYLDGRYKTDSIAELEHRVIAGGGGGYQWVKSDGVNFSTELGLAWLYEKFDDQTDSNDEISVQLGYNFDKRLGERVKFVNSLTYYPSTERASDYFLTTIAEVRASITERFYTNFKAVFDYDSTPAEGSGSTDVRYVLGVGMEY